MAENFASLDKIGIKKKILYPGKGIFSEYKNETKMYFHYKTTKCDDDRTVIDDSHKYDKPMEIILGKKFKLEVWETCLKTMLPNEVSEFLVDKLHLGNYPLVSKSLRGIFDKNKKNHEEEGKGHCCGMMGMMEKGLGHEDLDDLVKNPQPLIFTLELLKVERPGSFEKEVWTMTDEEKLARVPTLRETGNKLFKEKKYSDAAEKYAEAIGIVEQLSSREKPGDDEWHKLEDMKTPFLLNFSQCKLSLGEYYPVIEHTTTVLKREPDNVKALYRRAKAHVGAWNPEEAKTDFARVIELDPSLTGAVHKEFKHLEDMQREKDLKDKEKLKGLFSC